MKPLGRSRRHGGHPRSGAVAGSLVVAMALAAGPAAAQQPLPENNAGTGQYVEPVPDAEGDRRAAPRPSGGDRGGSGSPGGHSGLPGGEEGRILDRIASDPGSGAPSDAGGDGKAAGAGGTAGARAAGAPAEEEEGAAAALASAAVGSDSAALPIVLVAVLAMALTGLFVRSRRRS